MLMRIKEVGNKRMQEYVDEYYIEILNQEGFFCPDGNKLCWYRIVNDEIIHSLFFITRHGGSHFEPWMGFGIHPLYTEPYYTKSAYVRDPDITHDILFTFPIMATEYYRGGWLRETVLPLFQRVQTAKDCYDYNRFRSITGHYLPTPKQPIANSAHPGYLPHMKNFNYKSPNWYPSDSEIFGAICLEDKSVYPRYLERARCMLERRERWLEEAKPKEKKWYAKAIERSQWQIEALANGRREECLKFLEEKKQEMLKFLGK